MITSKDCWLKQECVKYKTHSAECESDAFCIKLFKLNELYNMSLLTNNQRKRIGLWVDEDKSDKHAFLALQQIQNSIEEFVNNGQNLYLYSHITGNGKTAWATRLMQSYFNKIWYKSDLVCKGLFINVPRYLLAIKDNISEKNEYASYIKDNVLTAELVIWDDIGTKIATSFEHENLLSIIDARLSNNKSNIFTSNLSVEQLKEIAGDRLYSRISGCSTCLQFVGSDKRGISQ